MQITPVKFAGQRAHKVIAGGNIAGEKHDVDSGVSVTELAS